MYEDIQAQRARMKLSQEQIDHRIDIAPLGPQGKAWARRWLDAESYGQVGLALFDIPPMVERGAHDLLIDVDGK